MPWLFPIPMINKRFNFDIQGSTNIVNYYIPKLLGERGPTISQFFLKLLKLYPFGPGALSLLMDHMAALISVTGFIRDSLVELETLYSTGDLKAGYASFLLSIGVPSKPTQ